MAHIVIEEPGKTCQGRGWIKTCNDELNPGCERPDCGKLCSDCGERGWHRRVLDPGSFVLIEKVDGEWPEWLLDDLEGRLAANIAEILDALAAESEQTGRDL